jgi:hypothetical protein
MKMCISSFVFLVGITAALAQNVLIHRTDGITETYALVDVRSITFDENDMNLTLVSGDTITWNTSFISYYNYEEVVPSTVDETGSVLSEFLAYPNPFSESINLALEISGSAMLELSVYNMVGQQVAAIASGNHSSGIHKYVWTVSGSDVSVVGTYLARLSIGDQLYHKLLIKVN